MLGISKLPGRIFRRCTGRPLFRAFNRWIILGFLCVCFFSLGACGSVNSTTYEAQRRGLLMLEGEHIYKNKGFYKTKKSHKRRKQAMRAHKRSLRH